MSTRRAAPRPWWHRLLSMRTLLPLFVLLCAWGLAAYISWSTVHRQARMVETQALEQMTLQLTYLQGTLEQDLLAGQLHGVREAVVELGSDPTLNIGLLVDDRQQVLASTRLALLGRPLHEAWPELARGGHVSRMQLARERLAGRVYLSEDRTQVVGYSPVRLSHRLPEARVGVLLLQQDLTVLKAIRSATVRRNVARVAGVLVAFSGLLGLIFHVALGRRVKRLVATAHRLAGGDLRARAGLRGVDELGMLGRAFDDMAEQLSADISARERVEAALRRSEESFRALIERSPDAILIHREGTVLFANPAAATMLGLSRAEALRGRRLAELVLPGQESLLSHPSGADTLREVHFIHAGGRPVLGEVVGVSLRFDGEPAVATMARDITERRQVQERLMASERMASLGTLSAGVAHEINNPLSYMLSNLRFVEDELRALAEGGGSLRGAEGEEVREALKEAMEGAERVRNIVHGLKTFSHGGSDTRGPVDVNAVLESCVNMARSELRHRARLVKDYGELPPVPANASRLGQVFLNLLVNAAQALPQGSQEANEIRLISRLERGQVVVAVSDTGVGISPENLRRLFDPFFTTKPVGVGTGLGLSICHGIIRELGGRITVESEPGRGSTFRVFLPVAERAPAATEELSPSSRAAAR
jgi:PAS domain S-box-containing protein